MTPPLWNGSSLHSDPMRSTWMTVPVCPVLRPVREGRPVPEPPPSRRTVIRDAIRGPYITDRLTSAKDSARRPGRRRAQARVTEPSQPVADGFPEPQLQFARALHTVRSRSRTHAPCAALRPSLIFRCPTANLTSRSASFEFHDNPGRRTNVNNVSNRFAPFLRASHRVLVSSRPREDPTHRPHRPHVRRSRVRSKVVGYRSVHRTSARRWSRIPTANARNPFGG